MRKSLLFAAAVGLISVVRAEDAAFVANKDAKVDSLSAEQIHAILLGTQVRFDSGVPVKLAILTEGALAESVVHTHAQRSLDQFEKYWKRLVFTGKGSMPQECATEAEMIAYVEKTPGAFGYLDKSKVTAGVTTVTVK
jgi:ABC-type phosphate transport system substrate-binding protein